MLGWISRFFGRLEQNHRGKSLRPAGSTLRTWEAFLEADLGSIVRATASNGAARRMLQHRLATACEVISRARGERQDLALEILTKACHAAGDNRREALRRGAVSFEDPDMAAAFAAETWFLAAIQQRQRQIDDGALRRIESLIDQLRAPA